MATDRLFQMVELATAKLNYEKLCPAESLSAVNHTTPHIKQPVNAQAPKTNLNAHVC